MTDLTGKQLGKYTLTDKIGAGGMGAVYRSHHPQLNLAVAIKLILGHVNEEARKRFLREAQTVAQLSHPGIVRIFDVDEADSIPYIVMELIQGDGLDELLKQGRLGMEQMLEIGIQLAEALDYAHSEGVLHRDLKPANVLIRPNGKAVLVDFGLARMAQAQDQQITQSGMIIGTLAYMAPEQLQAQSLTNRTDIYALGVLLYQMVTGKLPYEGDTAQIMYGHVYAPPPLASSTGAMLPPALDNLITTMLAKSPDARPQSAGEVAHILRNIKRDATTPPVYGAVSYSGPTIAQAAPPLTPATGPTIMQQAASGAVPNQTWQAQSPYGMPPHPAHATLPPPTKKPTAFIGALMAIIIALAGGGVYLLLQDSGSTGPEIGQQGIKLPPPPTFDIPPIEQPIGQPPPPPPPPTRTPEATNTPAAGSEPALSGGTETLDNGIEELERVPAKFGETQTNEMMVTGVTRRVTEFSDSTYFHGLLQNNFPEARERIKLTLVLYQNGEQVATDDGYVSLGYLEPGQQTGWKVLFSDSVPEYDSYAIEVNSSGDTSFSKGYYLRDFEVQELNLEDGSFGAEIKGLLENTGSEPAQFVQIYITFFDAQENVIGFESTFINGKNLEPGEQSRFDSSLVLIDYDDVAHYEFFVEGSEISEN